MRTTSAMEMGCDRWPLHYACRKGNLEQVQCLVDVHSYPVNEADTHDATPLYLAALTGHTNICQFLLERGATCEHSDAARIFYVALTPSLRRMLRDWSLTAASRDPYLDSLRHAFQTALGDDERSSADCTVSILMADSTYPEVKQVRSIPLHTIMVRARCPWLAQYIVSNPVSSAVPFAIALPLPAADSNENGDLVYLLLEYLYTGRMELRDFDKALVVMTLAEKWELTTLHTRLKDCIDRYVLEGQTKGAKNGVTSTELSVSATVSSVASLRRFRCDISDVEGLRRDMKALAALVSTPHCEVTTLVELTERVEGSDVTLQCQDCTWSVHRFRLATQSDYFARALHGHFREASTSTLDLSQWDETSSSPEAVKYIIQWMYADCFLETVTLELGVLVLHLGMALLVQPRLSSYIATTIFIPSVSFDTVFFLLDLARTHGSFERLEEACCLFIAQNIQGHYDVEESSFAQALLELFAEEAKQIVQGGDGQIADVPLAADIRRAVVRLNDEEDLKRQKVAKLRALVQQAVFGLSEE